MLTPPTTKARFTPMSISLVIERRDEEGELINGDSESLTLSELAGRLRYELPVFSPSASDGNEPDVSVGSDLTQIHFTDYTAGEGDRAAIERGERKHLSIHYDRNNDVRHIKAWRKLVACLIEHDRILV